MTAPCIKCGNTANLISTITEFSEERTTRKNKYTCSSCNCTFYEEIRAPLITAKEARKIRDEFWEVDLDTILADINDRIITAAKIGMHILCYKSPKYNNTKMRDSITSALEHAGYKVTFIDNEIRVLW